MKSPHRPEPTTPVLQFRLRVIHRGEIALGPGKVELLIAIRSHGSISRAAKSLGMSYMRAWTLVKVMNSAFRQPLVAVERGGSHGGAALLTPLGQRVLLLYADLIRQSQAVARPGWNKLQKLLKK